MERRIARIVSRRRHPASVSNMVFARGLPRVMITYCSKAKLTGKASELALEILNRHQERLDEVALVPEIPTDPQAEQGKFYIEMIYTPSAPILDEVNSIVMDSLKVKVLIVDFNREKNTSAKEICDRIGSFIEKDAEALNL